MTIANHHRKQILKIMKREIWTIEELGTASGYSRKCLSRWLDRTQEHINTETLDRIWAALRKKPK